MKNKTSKKELEEYEEGKEYLLASPGLWVHECCRCGLKHYFFLETKDKGKTIRILAFSDFNNET